MTTDSPEQPPTTAATTATTTTDPVPLITPSITELQDLAIRGSWKTILDKVTRARSLSLLRYPHEQLIFLTFNAIALTKLRRYSDALDDINATVDSLDHPSLRYEAFPTVYPSRLGSMVPFSLRWLRALLPSLLKSPNSIDPMYLLLSFVRSHIELQPTMADLWKRREKLVMNSLISIHSNQKEYTVCVSLLKEMISKYPNDAVLVSKLGYVQLQFGDLEGAKSSFDHAEKMDSTDLNLASRNKALIYMVGKDYVSAVREYDECIERDGNDVVAINNKALCLMYLRDLSDSIKVLEGSLERVPTVALNETLVVNLCSMYELAFVNHSDLKKTLSNWIARVAPDDFDSTCTRV